MDYHLGSKLSLSDLVAIVEIAAVVAVVAEGAAVDAWVEDG